MKKNSAALMNLPLRALATTLMLGLDPKVEVMSEEDIDTHEGAYRDPDDAGNLGRYGIEVHNVTVEIGSDRDNAPSYESHLFCRGQEVVIMDLDVPDYCDDETDAYIVNVSEVMTPDAARAKIKERLASYREQVEQHIRERGEQMDDLFEELIGAGAPAV